MNILSDVFIFIAGSIAVFALVACAALALDVAYTKLRELIRR